MSGCLIWSRVSATSIHDCVLPIMNYFVYILASKKNGTLYVGVTKDLVRRVHEHKNNLVEGFSKK